jgi:hypothetical protein
MFISFTKILKIIIKYIFLKILDVNAQQLDVQDQIESRAWTLGHGRRVLNVHDPEKENRHDIGQIVCYRKEALFFSNSNENKY